MKENTPTKFYIGDKVYAPHIGREVYTLRRSRDEYQTIGFNNKEPIYPLDIDVTINFSSRPSADLTTVTRYGKLFPRGQAVIFPAIPRYHKRLEKQYSVYFDKPPKYINVSVQNTTLYMPEGSTIQQALTRIEEMESLK